MTSTIFSSISLNIIEPVTLSVKKEGECYATLEGYSGKIGITVNIFEPSLIYFAIENIKKNSHWQIKGDQLIHVDHIDGFTITSLTVTCKSISPVPYLDNNGNWITQNLISPPLPPSSSVSSTMTPLINSALTTFLSSSETKTTETTTESSSASPISSNHHDKEPFITSISRDITPKQFDRVFLCLIYHFIMDISHPLHNDITIDWESEHFSKRLVQEKLVHFHDPHHYSYVSEESLAIIHNQYSSFFSSRYQSKNSTPSSSSSSSSGCSTTLNSRHQQQQQQKRKRSETIDDSGEKGNGSYQESTTCKSQKSHH